MNPNILKDILGVYADLSIKDIKKKHEKSVKREKRKLDMIYDSVVYFDKKMEKRRAVLEKGIARSIKRKAKGSFEKMDCWWRKEYNTTMKGNR